MRKYNMPAMDAYRLSAANYMMANNGQSLVDKSILQMDNSQIAQQGETGAEQNDNIVGFNTVGYFKGKDILNMKYLDFNLKNFKIGLAERPDVAGLFIKKKYLEQWKNNKEPQVNENSKKLLRSEKAIADKLERTKRELLSFLKQREKLEKEVNTKQKELKILKKQMSEGASEFKYILANKDTVKKRLEKSLKELAEEPKILKKTKDTTAKKHEALKAREQEIENKEKKLFKLAGQIEKPIKESKEIKEELERTKELLKKQQEEMKKNRELSNLLKEQIIIK